MPTQPFPQELKNKYFNKLQDGIKQWSQFVAWSWTDFLAFGDDTNKSEQEKTLKKFFIKILQDQARYSYAVNGYGDENKKPDAYNASLKIKQLILEENQKIEDIKDLQLTLRQVYQKLTGQDPECLCDEEFMKMFHIEILTDSFSGYIREASDEEKTEIKAVSRDEDVQYILYLTYPPCPVFSEATVTKEQLTNWMQNKTEDGESLTDYLPPSAYIPVSFT